MSAKKKTAYIRAPRPPKIHMPMISDEVLDWLEAKCSIPGRFPEDRIADLWDAVATMKGWMKKNTDPCGFRHNAWHKIRTILEAALNEHDTAIFDQFAKAWTDWDVKKKSPKLKLAGSKSAENPWEKWKAKEMQVVAQMIDNLVPLLPENSPNSPQKLKVIEAIRSLQNKHKRAPTLREIEDKASITKNKVDDMLKEMGLKASLSHSKASV